MCSVCFDMVEQTPGNKLQVLRPKEMFTSPYHTSINGKLSAVQLLTPKASSENVSRSVKKEARAENGGGKRHVSA